MPHKKGHSWGDLGGDIKKKAGEVGSDFSKKVSKGRDRLLSQHADRKGNILQRAAHDQKVKDDDKKFVAKWKKKNEDSKKRGRSGGSGLTAEHRLEARKRSRAAAEKRADRQALRKSDPKAYRALKRKERREQMRLGRPGSGWRMR